MRALRMEKKAGGGHSGVGGCGNRSENEAGGKPEKEWECSITLGAFIKGWKAGGKHRAGVGGCGERVENGLQGKVGVGDGSFETWKAKGSACSGIQRRRLGHVDESIRLAL